jgi:hypothetical protein
MPGGKLYGRDKGRSRDGDRERGRRNLRAVRVLLGQIIIKTAGKGVRGRDGNGERSKAESKLHGAAVENCLLNENSWISYKKIRELECGKVIGNKYFAKLPLK